MLEINKAASEKSSWGREVEEWNRHDECEVVEIGDNVSM